MRLLFSFILLSLAVSAPAQQLAKFQLPTKNANLFNNLPDKFYMYTDRNFEGKSSKPWQGGAYGFTRNMKRTDIGIIGTRFHEGIDVKPLHRDKSGKPTDTIYPIALGTVVYANTNSKHSNYGKYVVVQHNWGSGPFFSLYAHLADVKVKAGDQASLQTPLGTLGYTGNGINKRRAHLHLEFNMLLSSQFDKWHKKFFGAHNIHGFFNGMNMIGLDIGDILKRSHQSGGIEIVSTVQKQEVYYRVTIPRNGLLELIERYPWLCPANPKTPSPSWEISLTGSGIPTVIVPSRRKVSKPTVTFVRSSRISHSIQTKGLVLGTGQKGKLSKKGLRYVELLATTVFQKPTLINTVNPSKP